MKRICYVILCLSLALAAFSGCAQESEINAGELAMVNAYIEDIGGGDAIPLNAAEDMNHRLYENTKTQETKTTWELIVGYVRNEGSEAPQELDYSLEFENGGLSFESDNVWEFIGG